MIFKLDTPPKPTAACTFRGICRWTTAIVIACVITLAVGAHSLWNRADRLIRAALEKQIELRVPTWHVTFDDARASWSGELRVFNLQVRAKKDDEPIVELPEVVLDLDMNLLFEHRMVQVRSVRLKDPLIHLHCDAEGHWNWQKLAKPRPADTPPPDVLVENAAILVEIDESASFPATDLRFTGIHGRANPESRHGFACMAEGSLQHVGHLNLAAHTDFAHGTWSVEGRCGKVDLEGLMRGLVGISPEARQRVADLSEANLRGRRRRSLQLASLNTGPVLESQPPAAAEGILAGVGVQADMRLEFRAAVHERGQRPEFGFSADIRDGQITNSVLPLPLYDIKGHVAVDNDKLVVRTLTASNGDSSLLIDGQWDLQGDNPQRRFICRASDLQIGKGLRAYLPPATQAKFDQLQPSGRFNIDVEYDASLQPIPLRLREFTVAEGSLRHDLFPYFVSNIEGTIRQDGSRFDLSFRGLAGGRKITLDGTAVGVTPDAGVNLTIHVDELPIDATLLQAFTGSRSEKLQKLAPVLADLNLSGIADWRIELERRFGAGQKFHLTRLRGNVSEGGLRYERFPYSVNALRGTIDFDAAAEAVWHFRDLQGVHGQTQISGQGSYSLAPTGNLLDLELTALAAPIDSDLRNATIKASQSLDAIWKELDPSGTIDFKQLQILWSPGVPVVVRLPSIQFRDARITPAAVPYFWDKVNGAARWEDHRLVIHTLQGWHGDTYLDINGAAATSDGSPLAYFEQLAGNSGWRLHLGDVKIRKLPIDDELRGALPTSVRNVVASIGPTQPIDAEFALDLRGREKLDPVTARWNMRATVPGGNLTLGVNLQNTRGIIEIDDAVYNGSNVEAVGSIQLEEATIMSLPFTNLRGPFRVHGNQITVGTPKWLTLPAASVQSKFAGAPFEAQLYRGRFQLNAAADFIPDNPEALEYTVDAVLADAKLDDWARVKLPRERLRGDVNGEVLFRGVGSDSTRIKGKGWIQVAPAELYDLPVLANIFQVIKFQPPQNSAFEYALGDFELMDGMFVFKSILLSGPALRLVGTGTAGFAGPNEQSLDFKLGTQVPAPNVPLLKPILERTLQNWYEVQVVGTASAPRVLGQPRFPAFDGFKGLLQMLEQGPRTRGAIPITP